MSRLVAATRDGRYSCRVLTRRAASIVGALRQIDRPIAVLALIGFISQVGVSIMLPLLPLYAQELGATPAQLGLMISAFAVTVTIGQLGSGLMMGRISARRQIPLGLGGYAIANALIVATSSAAALITFRALAGFGGGLAIIAERVYIARVAARERLAFTNGIVSAAQSAGSVLGPTVGGVLATISLRVPFLVVAITAAIALVGSLFLPREPERALASDTMPVLAADAVTDAVTVPLGPPVAEQTVPAAPAIVRTARRDRWSHLRPLVLLSLWNLAFNAGFGGWITTYSPLATSKLGIPIVQIGLIFAAFGIGSIVLGPWLAGIADRRGRRGMVAIGSSLVMVHILTLIVAAPVALVFATAIVAGGGLAAAQASWFAMLSVATDGGRRGRSFGMVAALSNLGMIIGATLAAAAWEAIDVTAGMSVAIVALALGTLSLVFVRPATDPRSG